MSPFVIDSYSSFSWICDDSIVCALLSVVVLLYNVQLQWHITIDYALSWVFFVYFEMQKSSYFFAPNGWIITTAETGYCIRYWCILYSFHLCLHFALALYTGIDLLFSLAVQWAPLALERKTQQYKKDLRGTRKKFTHILNCTWSEEIKLVRGKSI